MNIKKFISKFEEIFPKETSCDFDFKKIGLEVGDVFQDIKNCLITLDVTEDVIKEAIKKDCNLIITHHPFLYNDLSKHKYNSYKRNIIKDCYKNDIVIYAAHTNIDNSSKGMNYILANMLELSNITQYDEGMAVYGDIDISFNDFITLIKTKFELPYIKYSGSKLIKVKRIGLCGGSGSDFIGLNKKYNCDVFLTGEIKHSTALEYRYNGYNSIDVTHYAERFFKHDVSVLLSKINDEVKVIPSTTDTNPFEIF